MHADPRSFFPPDRFGEVRDIVPVGDGLSGAQVYSVGTSTGEFILRVHEGDRSAWSRAVAMQRLASDHGVAPAIAFVDEARAASVSVRVAGMDFGAAASQPGVRPAAFASLVATLARLHAVPLTERPDEVVDRPRLAQAIWASQVERPGFPSWAAGFGVRLTETCAVLAGEPRMVFSHNDLHPRNIVWDGSRVWLLDWERAGLAHPYLDLSTFSNFLNLDEDAGVALLGMQERTAIGARERDTFRATRDFARLVYGAVFLRLVPDLTQVEFFSREETPTLLDCYRQMAAGTLAPNTPRGQALLGAALLKSL